MTQERGTGAYMCIPGETSGAYPLIMTTTTRFTQAIVKSNKNAEKSIHLYTYTVDTDGSKSAA